MLSFAVSGVSVINVTMLCSGFGRCRRVGYGRRSMADCGRMVEVPDGGPAVVERRSAGGRVANWRAALIGRWSPGCGFACGAATRPCRRRSGAGNGSRVRNTFIDALLRKRGLISAGSSSRAIGCRGSSAYREKFGRLVCRVGHECPIWDVRIVEGTSGPCRSAPLKCGMTERTVARMDRCRRSKGVPAGESR